MLTIYGRRQRLCDGVSRRSFLKIGGFALGAAGGVSLADLLRAESSSPRKSPHKAVINIFLAGGPPHQDMWEIKTEAPAEIRGEFKPIDTAVPGIQIGQCFPRIAAMMQKFAAIRSVVGCSGAHDGFQCFSGWHRKDMASLGGAPRTAPVRPASRWPAAPSTFPGASREVPASWALPMPPSSRKARVWTTCA
jgi:hypothetical protein